MLGRDPGLRPLLTRIESLSSLPIVIYAPLLAWIFFFLRHCGLLPVLSFPSRWPNPCREEDLGCSGWPEKDPNFQVYRPIQVGATTISSFVHTRAGSHVPTHTPQTSSFHEQLFSLLAKVKEPLGGQPPGGNAAPVAFVVPDLSWKGSRAEVAVSLH